MSVTATDEDDSMFRREFSGDEVRDRLLSAALLPDSAGDITLTAVEQDKNMHTGITGYIQI